MSSYKNFKVSDLRDILKSRGLKGWTGLRKKDLISLVEDSEEHPSGLATEDAREMGKKTVKELRVLAKVRGVKIRSGANKNEIAYLIGENYGERRRAYFERKFGLWDSDINASEDITQWQEEISEEERPRRPLESAVPKLVREAMNGRVQKWFVDGSEYLDPDVFLYDIADRVKKIVVSVSRPKKVSMNLSCILEKEDPRTGKKEEDTFGVRSWTYTIITQLEDMYEEMKDRMRENLSKFQKNGSGWRLKSIIGLEIGIVRFDPLSGSGYSKLPPAIMKKKTVINMRNEKCGKEQCECNKCKESEMCFKWAVTRALNPVNDNPHGITNELREQAKEYNWEGIRFPVKVEDIHIWEKNNNKFVNVYGYDEDSKKIYNIKMCDGYTSIILGENETQDDKFVNLFLHKNNHYCVIRSLSRLVNSQYNKHKSKGYFCLKCQNGFSTDKILESHQEVCLQSDAQTCVYPKPGETTKFKNYERLHDVPFAMYANFESFVEPVQCAEQDPSKLFTNKYQNHIPSGFCYTIKCVDESIYCMRTVLKTASYEGEDMGKVFVDSLTEDIKPVYEILKNPKPMVMSDFEKSQHEKAKKCYACQIKFGSTKGKEQKVTKCRDHCHITGKYRGAACNKCNLRMRVPMFVPVLFHNLEGYDSHLFVKSLGLAEGDIRCIPKTDEKYISFSKNVPMENGKEKVICLEMRFLDSLKFMRGL